MGRDKQTRYRMSMGLAFGEERDMKMLREMAARGWILDRYGVMGYYFKKGEPRDLDYCMDTQYLKEEEREQYFSLFEEAGWTHECSGTDSIHFFSAPRGTKPIYTDKSTMIEKYRKGRSDVIKGVLVLGILWVIFLLLFLLLEKLYEGSIFSMLTLAISGGSFGMMIVMIIAGFVINRKVKRNKTF